MEEVKIYKKALEMACENMMLDVDWWVGKAKKELMEEGNLTTNQRFQLEEKINALQNLLGYRITHLIYDNHNCGLKHMYLQYKDPLTGVYSTKIIIYGTFVSFADDVFVSGKTYEIKKLLGGE